MSSSVKGRIVVGVDGSRASVEALRWAAQEAEARRTGISVVCCWTYPALLAPAVFQPPLTDKTFVDAARQVAKETVEEALGADADRLDVALEVMRGPAPLALVELSTDAAMVVVGCRGRGGFRGLLLGSVSQHVAEHAHCPVLVMHSHNDEED